MAILTPGHDANTLFFVRGGLGEVETIEFDAKAELANLIDPFRLRGGEVAGPLSPGSSKDRHPTQPSPQNPGGFAMSTAQDLATFLFRPTQSKKRATNTGNPQACCKTNQTQ